MRSLVGFLGAIGLQLLLVMVYVAVMLAIKYFVVTLFFRKPVE